MLSLKAVFRFHFLFFSSWNFVGSKSNVNTPCRDVLFLGPRIGGASILTPSIALNRSINVKRVQRRTAPTAVTNHSHRSCASAYSDVPAKQAAHPLTGSKPSCSHSTAYLAHSLKNIQGPPSPALLPKQRGRYYTFTHPAHLRRNSASQADFNHSHPTSTPLHQQSVTSLPSPQAINLTKSIPSHRKQQR